MFFSKELAKQLALKQILNLKQIQSGGIDQTGGIDRTGGIDQTVTKFALFDPSTDLATAASNLQPDAALGILTSTNTVEQLVADVPNNSAIVGIQFFHPADQIRVVELIPHSKTSKLTQALATKFILQSKKLPQTVKDTPGFLLNRVVYAYLQQAERLAESGVPVNWLEKAATEFGMPIGPFAVLDEIGLPLALSISTYLHSSFSNKFCIPPTLSKAIAAGMNGRATGCGTYLWQDDKRVGLNPDLQNKLSFKISDQAAPPEQLAKLAHAMILPMVDEAARCLEEKVVRRTRELDLCVVLGIGFPAFRGGLLKYADSVGIKKIIAEINEIYQQTAPANRISDYLMKLENESRGFTRAPRNRIRSLSYL